MESSRALTNLDIRCAELGQELAEIPKMEERAINAALAVLEEQGPYAMFLYIKAREKEVADKFLDECAEFLRKIFSRESQDIFAVTNALAENLDDLFFARDLLRTALAYARYHLKAKGSDRS